MSDTTLQDELRAIGSRRKYIPKRVDIIAARQTLGLSQPECAKIIHTSTRSWQQWEWGEREMKPRDWELFCLLTQSAEARAALLRLKLRRRSR